MRNLLEIQDVTIQSRIRNEQYILVDNLSLSFDSGETVGLIGESGCGKSITALGIMNLLPQNIQISSGHIYFEDLELNKMPTSKLRQVYGRKIGMVFQDPMTALNPVFTIGQQMSAPIKKHLKLSPSDVNSRCIELLTTVGIRKPQNIMRSYPFELSGGMQQRVVIAMAVSCNPRLLIADEPTTALDVTIQMQILQLIKQLVQANSMSLLIISHDMNIISMLSKKICVMYAGEIVEFGECRTVLENALHPYTEKLSKAAMELQTGAKQLTIVDGNVPRPGEVKQGCKFAERCAYAFKPCYSEHPPIHIANDGLSGVRCWKYIR